MNKIKKERKISKISLYLIISILTLSFTAGYFSWQNKSSQSINILSQKDDSELLKIVIPMAENFIQNFVNGDFVKASKDFNNEMKITINTQNLEIIQGQILTKIGNLSNLGQSEVTKKEANFLILEYPESKFTEEEKVLIRIVFKNDSQSNLKISGFWFDSPKINSN